MPEFSEEIDLKVVVNDKAAEAFAKLSDAMERVAKTEVKMERQTRALTQAEERLEQRRRDFARDRAEAAELARKRPTLGDRAAAVAGGAQTLATGGVAGLAAARGGVAGLAFAATFGAVDAGLNKIATAANTLNAGMLTEAQKREELAKQFIPLYASLKNLKEALDGTTEGIAAAERKFQRNMADREALMQKLEREAAPTAEIIPQAELARAFAVFGGRNVNPIQTFDRSSAIGARQYAEQQTVLPAQEELRRAKIREAAAQSTAGLLERQAEVGLSRVGAAQTRADVANENLNRLRRFENQGGEREKLDLVKAVRESQKSNADLAREIEFADAQIARHKEAQLQATRAEADVAKAALEVDKARLAVMEQREQRMAGFARSVGSMTEVEFEFSAAAAQAARDQGIKNLPPELRAAAGRVAPEFIGKEEEKLGEQRARELARRFGSGPNKLDDSLINDFRQQTLQEVRARVDQMRADIRINVDINEQSLAKNLATELQKIFDRVLVTVEARVRQIEDRIRIQQIGNVATQG